MCVCVCMCATVHPSTESSPWKRNQITVSLFSVHLCVWGGGDLYILQPRPLHGKKSDPTACQSLSARVFVSVWGTCTSFNRDLYIENPSDLPLVSVSVRVCVCLCGEPVHPSTETTPQKIHQIYRLCQCLSMCVCVGVGGTCTSSTDTFPQKIRSLSVILSPGVCGWRGEGGCFYPFICLSACLSVHPKIKLKN